MIPAMSGKGLHRTGRPSPSPSFFLIAACLAALAASPVFAFTFSPISQDFSPTGAGSIQSFRLENEGPDPIAVRISMLTRDLDADCREVNAPADSLFVVYPSRAVLRAGSVQAIRVQWKGPTDLTTEKCYRILVEQLPVDFGSQEKQKGSIRVLFRYLGAMYIVPPGARPDVVLESAMPAADADGRTGLLLVLANRGTAHAILSELTVTVTSGAASGAAQKRSFGPEELAGISGENLLPGTARRHFLALPEDFPRDDINVAFSFEAVR